MNNEQQSEQQKAIRRFFIGSFFIALLCAAVVDLFLASMDHGSDDVVWVFFYTFLSYLYLVRLQRLFFTSLRKKQVATIVGIFYWHF